MFGSHEFFNDGPTKQDLTSADRIIHVHFGMNHYNGSTTELSSGEPWRKMWGPFLLYLNTSPAGADACWADAKMRAQTEQAAWPYSWLTTTDEYPVAAARGSVAGQLSINEPLRPGVSSAGAWLGLAQPDASRNWQFESKRYQFWTRADAAGNFVIPNVRAGTYTLYAFTPGAVGEYVRSEPVTVTPGSTKSLGTLVWRVWHPGESIAWEVGIPDRTASKFWHGDDYFQPFLWQQFADEFPNPLEFTIGYSDPRTDWNYVHSCYPPDWTPWPWRINFALANLPATGNATLTLAFASANSARVDVYVNNAANPIARVYPSVSGGNALVREGIHAKYCVEYVPVPLALLGVGANSITLVQGRTSTSLPFEHVMYDYVNLELPAGATAALLNSPPRPTRRIARTPRPTPQTVRRNQPGPVRP